MEDVGFGDIEWPPSFKLAKPVSSSSILSIIMINNFGAITVITVNGKQMAWKEGLTVEEILNSLDEDFSIVVVKVNGKPVLKKEYPTFKVPDDAELVTVDIIAGG